MAAFQWFRRLPGLTRQQAESRAQRIQRLAEQQEKHIIVEAPGDVSVRATSDVTLSGTGTSFDQTYQIETVQHRFSVNDGYTMTITGKNSSQGDTGYSGSSGDTLSPPTASNPSLPNSGGFSGFTTPTNPVTGNPIGSPGTV